MGLGHDLFDAQLVVPVLPEDRVVVSRGVRHGRRRSRGWRISEWILVARAAAYFGVGQATDLVSRYWSNPAMPFCRPMPLCLYPPKGMSACPIGMPPLTAKVPVRIRSATPSARSSERREDAAREPVDAVVGDADRVVVVVEGDDDEHRAEDLLLGDRHGVVDVGEQGRLDEPALGEVRRPASAQRQGRPLLDPLLDVAEHPVTLLGRDQRAHEDVGSLRVSVGDRGQRRLQDLDALLVARAGEEHPGLNGAALPAVEADGDRPRAPSSRSPRRRARWSPTCHRAPGRPA